ncbi:hypothetical protein [uncultured virus]|uniref:Uncharacterized protein n=1 Tax=uncultured virus TaxID=340016 RepID=A0A218ML72_9VIRU|nr:hypothetical protein [uncultured virus]|tara:strand:- start:432 stop:773 length:342 start_codon:yes stop_codon:yes gene_type:complete
MIKLTNILSEMLNTYQVEAYMLTDNSFNITDVLDQIRAVRKITIVRNITPEDYVQKPNVEFTLVSIKFITRGDAKKDLEKIKQDIETSDMSKTDLRVPGVKSFKYKPETLRRL